MIPHRVRQFIEASSQPTPEDYRLAAMWLDVPLLQLFERQHPRDIVHSAGTARWLLERGHDDPDLIAAALLHDIGKGHQRRFDRAAWVLAETVGQQERLASPHSRFELRRALHRTARHSSAGASLLLEAGVSPRVAELTARHHESPGTDRVLALLQQADTEN